MITEIHATGKTVNEAVEALRNKLAVDTLDNIDWKLVHTEKKGFLFSIGAQPAEVVAFIETPDPVVEKPKAEKKSAPKAETKKEELKTEKKVEKKTEAKKAPEKKAEKPKKPKTPTTDAEVKAAFSFVEALVKNLELNVSANIVNDEESGSSITISGDDAGMLIGHHGETLDAVQYLANLAANRAEGKDDHERITVDVEGYREKREETLRALARRMAAKVQKYGKSVMLEPMNPYERRIIHSEIQNIEGISTNSIGSDENRKVVIYLTEKGMGRLPSRDARGNRRGSHNRRRHHSDKNAVAENAAETTEE